MNEVIPPRTKALFERYGSDRDWLVLASQLEEELSIVETALRNLVNDMGSDAGFAQDALNRVEQMRKEQ